MCKEKFHAKTEKPKVRTCKRTRQAPKLCPGIAILEYGNNWSSGPRRRENHQVVFVLLPIEDRDSAINKSINPTLDHHKDYLYPVFVKTKFTIHNRQYLSHKRQNSRRLVLREKGEI